jgi:hypothetical protein
LGADWPSCDRNRAFIVTETHLTLIAFDTRIAKSLQAVPKVGQSRSECKVWRKRIGSRKTARPAISQLTHSRGKELRGENGHGCFDGVSHDWHRLFLTSRDQALSFLPFMTKSAGNQSCLEIIIITSEYQVGPACINFLGPHGKISQFICHQKPFY